MLLEKKVIDLKPLTLVTCHDELMMGDAVLQMNDEDISCLVIVDRFGGLLGLLTRTDVIRARLSHSNWAVRDVGEFMSKYVITVSVAATVEVVMKMLLQRRIHRVVVIDTTSGISIPKAVVSDSDIMLWMAEEVDLASGF